MKFVTRNLEYVAGVQGEVTVWPKAESAASRSETVRRKRQTADPAASLSGDEAPDAHDTCTPASQRRVALDSLARRYQGRHAFALRARARASGTPRLLAQRTPVRGVAPHRVAN